jgi:heat shock protein HspQ
VTNTKAKFHLGQLVHHKLFNYRGVIMDADPHFQGTEDWYEQVARSRPPKDQPWYRVLVHDAQHETYVAERNLQADDTGGPINHPLVGIIFNAFRDGRYTTRQSMN